MNINNEYYLLVRNLRNQPRINVDQKCSTAFSKRSNLKKPIHYGIDNEVWEKGIEPRDIIQAGEDGILIKDYLKEELFHKYDSETIKLHPAYITSPDERESFEGYWIAMPSDAPKEWLDVDNSVMDLRPNSRPGSIKYRGVQKYQLNTKVLKDIPLEDRLFFKLPYEYGTTHKIIHRSLVEYMGKIPSEKRDKAFVPILDANPKIKIKLPSSAI